MSSPTSENSKKKIIINVIIFIVVAAALAVVIYFIIQVTKLKGANPETQKPTISMEKTIITKLPTIWTGITTTIPLTTITGTTEATAAGYWSVIITKI